MHLKLLLPLALFSLFAKTDMSPIEHSASRAADRVEPNDNRRAAGILRNGVLQLALQVRSAMWYPDGEKSPGTSMLAFAEEGKAARIPGPLVRVPAGTEAVVSVVNSLADTLLLYGLHSRGSGLADASPLTLAPGQRRTVRFRLNAAGTFYYWATTSRRAFTFRIREDAQLTGAIVVDDSASRVNRDRIFVIGMWTDTVGRAMMRRQRVLAVINGRSWPTTERLIHTVGDTLRWRLINGSADLHPMHLHGFYFRVDSRGDGVRDTAYAGAARGMAVTESMPGGSTRDITWIPERAGNWLFHCHVPEHFAARSSLGLRPPAETDGNATAHSDHASGGMNGMVMGVEVRPSRTAARNATAQSAPIAANERVLRLLVRPNRGSSGTAPWYSYAVHERGDEPAVDSGLGIGPTLDLIRGQPVRITIVNRLAEPTAVHWHGIELESYYDGVPGFSGAARRLSPMVAAGDSFVVRFTPPRAGTFIYHTHALEERQQLAGLAGALIVTEPGSPRNNETDIPIVISAPTEFVEQGRRALVNGQSPPATQTMRVGRTYRLRIVQMSVSRSILRFELLRDSAVVSWRPVAKDGADLPEVMRALQPARAPLGIGETRDFEVTPASTGLMKLEIRVGATPTAPSVLLATLPISVVPDDR